MFLIDPEFGSTLSRRLNQSCFPAVLQSNQITIKFGTAEARRLNWALELRHIQRGIQSSVLYLVKSRPL